MARKIKNLDGGRIINALCLLLQWMQILIITVIVGDTITLIRYLPTYLLRSDISIASMCIVGIELRRSVPIIFKIYFAQNVLGQRMRRCSFAIRCGHASFCSHWSVWWNGIWYPGLELCRSYGTWITSKLNFYQLVVPTALSTAIYHEAIGWCKNVRRLLLCILICREILSY